MPALLSVGPTHPVEDEQRIATGYQRWVTPIMALAPPVVAYFADTALEIPVTASRTPMPPATHKRAVHA